MLSSHRALTLVAASGAVAAVAMPVAALAHGDRGGRRRSAHSLSGPKRICRQVGVPLTASSHGDLHANGYGRLTATQIEDLQTACNQLAEAYTTEHNEDTTAFTALEPELSQLNAACPRSHGHHGHHGHHGSATTGSTGSTGPSGTTGVVAEALPSAACEEARNAFRAADETYRLKRKEAASAFDKALATFDETVTATLGTDVAHGHHHRRSGSTGSTGWTGPSGWSGPSGSSGSTGSTGSMAPTLPTGPTGPGPVPGARHLR